MSVALVIVSGTPQVGCSTTTSSTTATAAYPNNVTKGNLLTAINGSQGSTDSTTAVSISDTLGNTWTPVWASIQSPSGGTVSKFIQGWYCISKASGANTVSCVITQSGTLGSNAVFVAEFSGFSGSATLDQKAAAASSGSTTMNELDFNNTLTNDAVFVASITNIGQLSASTVNSPFTGAFFSPLGGNYNYLIAYGAEASSGLYKFTGTWNVGTATMQWSAGFTISAGAGVPNSFMLLGVGT